MDGSAFSEFGIKDLRRRIGDVKSGMISPSDRLNMDTVKKMYVHAYGIEVDLSRYVRFRVASDYWLFS